MRVLMWGFGGSAESRDRGCEGSGWGGWALEGVGI